MANPQIVVDYIANTAKLSKATGDVEKAGGRVSNTMKGVGGAVAAGLAVGAVVAFGKSTIGAAEESEKATQKLDQVFKSMGDSTGQAAKAAADYASSLGMQVGIEDELIMSGQTMLATFGKVSSATARTAGIFDRATAAGVDLAAAGFGSIESNAVQLGKALQDPIKGLAALGRSGVTFTDAQKDMIKNLVESGQHLEAQKVVLAAIEKQVGGTAAASVSESEKMAVAYGEVQESVGMVLLPVLQELAPMLVKVAGFIAKNSSVIVPLVAGITAAALAIKVITIAQIAWNVAMTANPIGIIVVAIGALVVAIVLLWKNWDKVTAAFKKGFELIKDGAKRVFDWIKDNWPLLLGILGGQFALAVVLIVKNWDKIKDGAKDAYDAIKGAIGRIADLILGQVGRVSSAVKRIVDAIKKPINAVLGVWNAISFTVPEFPIPSVTVLGKKIGGGSFGGQTFGVKQIPLLAKGGIVTGPTLAMLGEAGPEAVIPLSSGNAPIEVRVFIGDQELTQIVRTEIVDSNTGLARTLLAGGRA